MAKRKIIWTNTADQQLTWILAYWVARNKSTTYANRLLEIVARKSDQIAEQPSLFKQTSFKNVRVASLGHFAIFFKVEADKIFIMAFWDNRQDPKKLLQHLRK